MQGRSPLEGLSKQENNSVFIAMDQPYDVDLGKRMQHAAATHKIALHQGVYAATLGPEFETVAQVKSLALQGADLVGMSTVSEVIMGRYFGMSITAVSIITNLACGLADTSLSHEVTLAGAKKGADNLKQILSTFVAQFVSMPAGKVLEQ